MGPPSWTMPALELLLELYNKQTLMYNPKHKLYHNRNARYDCEQEIAKELRKIRPGTTYQEVKTKINNMRTAFKAELAKATRKTRPGEEYVPSLWYFNKMMFLTQYMKVRPSLKLPPHENGDPLNENADDTNEDRYIEKMEAPDSPDAASGSDWSAGSNPTARVSTDYYQPKSEGNQTTSLLRMSTSENCDDVIQSINKNLQTIARRSSIPPAPAILTSTQAFGNFITASLNEIQSPIIREECETEMLVILLKAKKKDRYDSNSVD